MRKYSSVVAVFFIAVFIGSLSYFNSSAAAPADIVHPVSMPMITTSASQPGKSTATPQPTATLKLIAKVASVKGNNLSIPSIGLLAPITSVGVTATNNIDVPNGAKVGRWTGSATPGTPGAVFLDGHVDGVFAGLSKINVGQIIKMTYSGKLYVYRVVLTEVVPLATIDMNRSLSVMSDSSIEGLNIMTCAGKYVPSQDTYDHRLVVYAVRYNT